jgi:transcriptional regulator with XRE-family HTH domain
MIKLSESDLAAFPKALGTELRRRRTERGWSRRDLLRRLPNDVSVQTLATYELGTRAISVLRLVELCEALGTTAHELLANADGTIRPPHTGLVRIDLRAVARTSRHELAPARRWAVSRLHQLGDDESPMTTLDRAAVEQLARLCGLSPIALTRGLVGGDRGREDSDQH